MKHLRSFEKVDINKEQSYKKYEKEVNTSYSLVGVLFNRHGTEYDGHQRLITANLETCLNQYEVYYKTMEYDDYFIIKETSESEVISGDDFQMLVNSRKYNL